MKTNIKVKNVVEAAGTDMVLPFTLVYVFYVILHGHLSPGGGFQGGVLAASAVVFIYLGHGYKTTVAALNISFMRKTEGLAVTVYIVLAMMGVVLGAQFCQNFAFDEGPIGALISSGTIAWMDEAVGLNVLTGVSVLVLSMMGILVAKDGDEKE